MIKRLLAFLAVIWLIIAILAPSFLAPQIDAQLHAFFDSAEAHRLRANGIDLQLDNYQRGYFSSQADIHVNIRPYEGQPTWYRTTLHARINHAPLFNSGINLISATLTNSDSDGRYAPYLPDGHLRLQTRIAILGQIHQLIRIEPNHTTNLNSDGLRLSWHSHIRTPDRGNGEWLLGKQQWLEGRYRLELARSSGTYRNDGEALRLSAAQLNLTRRDYRCVLNLTRRFAIHHPNHPHIVDNYHFAALAMDKTGKSEDALLLLQKLRTHYPEHTCLTDIMQTIAHHSRQRSHEQHSTNTPPATSYVLYILMQTLLGGGLAALAFAFLSPLKGGEAFGWVLLGYVLLCFPLALVCFVAGITLSIIVTILTYVGAMALFAATTKETMSDFSSMMSTILTSASLSTLVLSIFLPAAPPTDDAD